MTAESAAPSLANNQEVHYDFAGMSRGGKLDARAVPEASVWQNQPGTDGEVRFAWGDDGHSIVPAPHLPTYTWMAKAPRKAMLTALKELSAHRRHSRNTSKASPRDAASTEKPSEHGSSSSSHKQKLDSMPPFPIPLPPPDGGHVKAPAGQAADAARSPQLDKGSEVAQKRFDQYLARSTDKLSVQLDDYFYSLAGKRRRHQSAAHAAAGAWGHAARRAPAQQQLFSKFEPANFANMHRELRQLRKGLNLDAPGASSHNARGDGRRGRAAGRGWHDHVLSSRESRWLRREHARSLEPLP